MNFYSQSGQDKFIYKNFFMDKKDGFFVDIGASDGVKFSNTLFFEELGWNGICVEPLQDKFDVLTKNRKATCVNTCLYDREGIVSFAAIDGYSNMLSGIVETYNDKHAERIEKELKKFSGSKTILNVACTSLTNLLSKYNVTQVDFCSLDTEGSELQILQGLDFSSIFVNVFSIENNFKDDCIEKFLSSKNYKLVHKTAQDDIYCHI